VSQGCFVFAKSQVNRDPHFQLRIEEDPKGMMDGWMDMVYVMRVTLHEESR
jgi:hypothetical protein